MTQTMQPVQLEAMPKDPFHDTNRLLAEMGFAPDGTPLEAAKPAHEPKHAHTEEIVAPAPARVVSLPVPVASPVVAPASEVVQAEPEPVAPVPAQPAPAEVVEEPAAAAAERAEVTDLVVEQLEANGHHDLAEAVTEDGFDYDTVYAEALAQYEEENDARPRRKRRSDRELSAMAHDIAERLTQGPDGVLGFTGEPNTEARPKAGSLRDKAYGLLLRAGIILDSAREAISVKSHRPEHRRLKLVAGAAGIVAFAGLGLLAAYKGIDGFVNATIPNLEMFDQASKPSAGDGASGIASR